MKQKEQLVSQNTFYSFLPSYQKIIEQKICKCIEGLGPKNQLRDACEYALLSGGKRFRPAITLMVAKALGFELDATEAALAVELFHCASLVADDLPCMDNDDMRRDKPSLHKVYGEATSLLATYALIAAGYHHLQLNADSIKACRQLDEGLCDRICVLALANASYNTGLSGATGGQFLDIYPENLSPDMLERVVCLKTVSLFEISFVLGWLYGGGRIDQIDKVKRLSYHFGMAYQVVDDIDDMDQDIKNQRQINMANVLGKEKAIAMVRQEIGHYTALLRELAIDSDELKSLGALVLSKL